MKRVLPVLLLLLLLPAAAAAPAPITAQLEAQTILLDDEVRLSGPEAAAVVRWRYDLDPADFSLEIQKGVIEVDRNPATIVVAGSVIGVEDNRSTEKHDMVDAELLPSHYGEQGYLFLDGSNGSALAEATAHTMTLAAGADEPWVAESHIDAEEGGPIEWERWRESWTAHVAARHSVSPGAQATLVLEGTFRLTFWDLDVEVREPDDTWLLRTGYVERPGPAPGTESAEGRQAYVLVEQGRLEVRIPAPEALELMFDAAHADAGLATFRSSTGTLQGTQGERSVLDRDIRVQGPLSLEADPVEQERIPVVVRGGSSARFGDEQVILTQTTSPASPRSWTIGLALLLVVPPAAVIWHRRDLGRIYRRMEDHMEMQDFESVADAPHRIARSRRYGADAAFMRTVALLQLDRVDEAEQSLEEVPRDGPDSAGRHYLETHLRLRQGRLREARDALALCLQKNRFMQDEADRDPQLAKLIRELLPEREGYT